MNFRRSHTPANQVNDPLNQNWRQPQRDIPGLDFDSIAHQENQDLRNELELCKKDLIRTKFDKVSLEEKVRKAEAKQKKAEEELAELKEAIARRNFDECYGRHQDLGFEIASGLSQYDYNYGYPVAPSASQAQANTSSVPESVELESANQQKIQELQQKLKKSQQENCDLVHNLQVQTALNKHYEEAMNGVVSKISEEIRKVGEIQSTLHFPSCNETFGNEGAFGKGAIIDHDGESLIQLDSVSERDLKLNVKTEVIRNSSTPPLSTSSDGDNNFPSFGENLLTPEEFEKLQLEFLEGC